MSTDHAEGERETDSLPICEYCGFAIEQVGQRCPALDEGGCVP